MTVPSSMLAPKVIPLPLSQVRRQLSTDFCCWCAIGGQHIVLVAQKASQDPKESLLSLVVFVHFIIDFNLRFFRKFLWTFKGILKVFFEHFLVLIDH